MVEDKAIYKHAFWLYGVIIGLAIKEALDSIVPHWINYIPSVHPVHGLYLEVLRLFTFLIFSMRFYLGSAYYFGLVHESDKAENDFPHRSFGTDFVVGFLHFLGFVFLALTIRVHNGEPIRLFVLGVAFILVYDVAWALLSWTWKLDTTKKIKWWAFVNGGTAVVALAVYLMVERITGSSIVAETWTLYLIFVVSLFDIGWMMRGKPFFEPVQNWFN